MAEISGASFCDTSGVVEEWRGVTDSVGTYGVSDKGKVRSKRYRNGKPSADWRILKPSLDTEGYPYVCLYLHGKRTVRRVAHLVADAFLPPKSLTDKVVRHLNDQPADNRAVNLARGTHKDNAQDSIRNDTFARGIAHGRAKLTEDDVREVRRLYATGKFTQRELALKFDVSQMIVYRIVRRKAWKHVL